MLRGMAVWCWALVPSLPDGRCQLPHPPTPPTPPPPAGHGLQQLKDLLFSSTTPGEWLLEDPGAATDRSPPEVALEVVREKLFQRLYKELPYRLSLAPVGFNVLNDGSVRVEQDILVPTSGARKIVVGRQGAVVGSIGALARAELQELWGRNVHLYLNVKQADV